MPVPPRPDNPWQPEEEVLLVEHYGKVPWDELERLIPGRTRIALKGRAQILGLAQPKDPPWSQEEIAYLREAFGTVSLTEMARHLGRSPDGVKLKAKRLGLRHRRRRALTPSQIGQLLGLCSKQVKAWIRRRLLAARLAPTAEKRIHLVEPEDLVAFLREHPEAWDARRCPDLHIKLSIRPQRRDARRLERPLWLKEKLAADIARGRRAQRWTPAEDARLAQLVKRGLPYRQIGELLGRTQAAVDHRVHRLGRRIWKLAAG